MRQLEFFQKQILLRALITKLVILFFLLNTSTEGAPLEKQITVVFRFDDYSTLSQTEFEVKLINSFREYNAVCTFGVIPFVCAGDIHDISPQDIVPLTLKKAAILKRAIKEEILEVALHGYSHQTIRSKQSGRYTEFSGLDIDGQVSKIAKGKDKVEEMLDIKVATFIPPWNVYDTNTILAAENLGFKCFSASELVKAPESSLLTFAPSTCNLLQLRQSVDTARRVPDRQPVIIVLFHEYDFLEIDKERGWMTYKGFLELLSWITSQRDIHIMTLKQITKAKSNMDVLRFNNNISFGRLTYLIPPLKLFDNMYPTGVLLSSNTVVKMKFKCGVYLSLFYFLVFLVSATLAFFIGFTVFTLPNKLRVLLIYGGTAVSIFLVLNFIRSSVITYNDAIATITFIGAYIGLLCCFFKLKG